MRKKSEGRRRKEKGRSGGRGKYRRWNMRGDKAGGEGKEEGEE